DEENVRDFQRDLFFNFGRHLFARIVRRFCSYIKQTPNLPTPKLRTLSPSSHLRTSILAAWRLCVRPLCYNAGNRFSREGAKAQRGQRSEDREQRTEVRRSQRRIRPLADQRAEAAKFQKRQAPNFRETPNSKF